MWSPHSPIWTGYIQQRANLRHIWESKIMFGQKVLREHVRWSSNHLWWLQDVFVMYYECPYWFLWHVQNHDFFHDFHASRDHTWCIMARLCIRYNHRTCYMVRSTLVRWPKGRQIGKRGFLPNPLPDPLCPNVSHVKRWPNQSFRISIVMIFCALSNGMCAVAPFGPQLSARGPI